MPSFILNTCGTSVLTNQSTNEQRTLINKYTNAANWNVIPDQDRAQIQNHIQQRQAQLQTLSMQDAKKMSAELNGLLTWREQRQAHPQDQYWLLATDTVLGQAAAQMVQTWLEQEKLQANILRIQDLRTNSLDEFRSALSDLAKQLKETLEGYRNQGYTIHFNLTGGFKSLNGFLQALSTIYADEAFYRFETGQDLLNIPKLPFEFNPQRTIEENILPFRRLGHGLSVDATQVERIPDSLLLEIDRAYGLSEWGELIWLEGHPTLYREKLLPSISDKVIFDVGFETSTKDLTPQRLAIVNTAIARLGEWTEGGFKTALKSLDPKPLTRGDFKGQDIWECDLDDFFRIYFHKKGDSIRLQKVDKALH